MTIKARKPWIKEDTSPSNLIKNSKGNITGYQRSRYTVGVPFEISKLWVPFNREIIDILVKIAECEDKKYLHGQGRNMFLLAYLYPVYKKYLEEHGFKPIESELEKAQQQARKKDQSYDNFLESMINEDKD